MEAEKKQLALFLAAIIISSALIAWSLVSLYDPLGSEYSEEYYDEEEGEETFEEEVAVPAPSTTRPSTGSGAKPASESR